MNEPKRRGRPPKAKLLDVVPGTPMDAAYSSSPVVAALERAVLEVHMSSPTEFDRRRAIGLARRVWDGQSPSLPRKERLERVRKALEKQGLSMEGVEL
jgi:hypothetical protein